MNHCRSFTVFTDKSRATRVSDTVEFRHADITVPHITPEDKVIHAISQLKKELASITTPNKQKQLDAICHLRNLFSKHSRTMKDPDENTESIRDKQK